MKSILYKYNPDVIIHFAAESHVDRSIDGPEKFAKQILLDLNLLHQSNQWLNESGRKAKIILDLSIFQRMRFMVV